MKVYFDESGQTGTHLADSTQTFFSIGSTSVGEAEAAEIVARCFPGFQGDELKSQKLLRRPKGQRGYIEFAREIGKTPDRFIATKVDKRFAIVSKMVDHLVEPLLSSQGYDFYAGDYAVRFANSSFYVFDTLLDCAGADGLMKLYNEFAREPSATTLNPLLDGLQAAEAHGTYGSEVFLGMMAEGARRFMELNTFDGFKDTNDVHVTSVIQCMAHWQAQDPGPFEVVHDESTHFFRRSERWKMMVRPDIPQQVIEIGDKTLTLPIPVSATTSARSHETPSLQLCDLVAGLVRWSSSSSLTDDDRRFFQEAIEAGANVLSVFPVEAGTDFAEGPPQLATGPDIIDQVVRAAGSTARPPS